MASKASADDLDKVTCAICKDVYNIPVKISCDHSFCEGCISDAWSKVSTGSPSCPICRKSVDGRTKMDMEMMTLMSMKSTSCIMCKKTVIFTEYRKHQIICKDKNKLGEASGTGRNLSPNTKSRPNYFTFMCPYCQYKNLDRDGLVTHVKERHHDDKTQVVCPICKVMPWGNPEQLSQNFYDHINLRHKFDYDRFVDFNQDEQQALNNALAASIRDY